MADKKKMGRKSKLTPELIKRICEYIAGGNYLITACQSCGIHRTTFHNWLQQGDNDIENGTDSIYASFLKEVIKAEAEAEQKMVAVVREAAIQKKEWLPAITFLERRYRERWGRPAPVPVNITVENSKRFNITRVEIVGPQQQFIENQAKELLENGKSSPENS